MSILGHFHLSTCLIPYPHEQSHMVISKKEIINKAVNNYIFVSHKSAAGRFFNDLAK